jgi:hypothetical protein
MYMQSHRNNNTVSIGNVCVQPKSMDGYMRFLHVVHNICVRELVTGYDRFLVLLSCAFFISNGFVCIRQEYIQSTARGSSSPSWIMEYIQGGHSVRVIVKVTIQYGLSDPLLCFDIRRHAGSSNGHVYGPIKPNITLHKNVDVVAFYNFAVMSILAPLRCYPPDFE